MSTFVLIHGGVMSVGTGTWWRPSCVRTGTTWWLPTYRGFSWPG